MSFKNKNIKKYLSKTEINALYRLKIELEKYWPDVKIKIFGSKVSGKFDDESDVDLLILLPFDVTEQIRNKIINVVFKINLEFETNISALILGQSEWESSVISSLPIHYFIEKEGILL